MAKINFREIAITGLIFFVLFIFYSNFLKEARTAGNVSLKGWAWIGADCIDPDEASCNVTTSPIGWVSLSSNNPEITCKNVSYGVSIDTSTGEIFGKAWIGVGEDASTADCNATENTVGWIDFDSMDTPTCGQNGYPLNDCFPAKVVGTEILGWAPIISKDYLGNTTTLTWVRFKGSNYGVNLNFNTGTSSGYAWSGYAKDGGFGWIKFLATVSTTTITPQAILNVQSSPTGVNITDRNNSSFSGTTNYTISSTTTISASLESPQTIGSGYIFDSWSCGSTSTNNNVCQITVNPGENKTATAYYKNTATTSGFDLSVTSLDIRTFICKNKNKDLTFWDEYSQQNSNYPYPPSTTYADEFYNKVASSTCPESQRDRPVEFSAQGTCTQGKGSCPPSKLKIDITSNSPSPLSDQEKTSFETNFDSIYPKSITSTYAFNKPYDYTVTACLVNNGNNQISDDNNSNNCQQQTIRIFDYMCLFSFCSQNQRDITATTSPLKDLMYKILKIFGDTDSPCRFYRNQICRAGFGF